MNKNYILYLSVFLCVCFLSVLGSACGCEKDILPFDIGALGLTRPSITFDEKNAARLISRVRWMELIREWNHKRINPHDLSLLIGKTVRKRLRSPCLFDGAQCSSCLDGTDSFGRLYLNCWTRGAFSGQMFFELAELESLQDESFVKWVDVCDQKASTLICADGTSSYQTKVFSGSSASPDRVDLLWLVRFWVTEGKDSPTFRLDGASSFVFQQRQENATLQRFAIFDDANSLIYKSADLQKGTVKILAANGNFFCSFTQKGAKGSCLELPSKKKAFSW